VRKRYQYIEIGGRQKYINKLRGVGGQGGVGVAKCINKLRGGGQGVGWGKSINTLRETVGGRAGACLNCILFIFEMVGCYQFLNTFELTDPGQYWVLAIFLWQLKICIWHRYWSNHGLESC
jgi:hypothetical protein